jgi:DNA repair photolyase
MMLEFQEYQAKRIVNTHKHVDDAWFWDKYSAHPYIGCRHGCEFCYSRGDPYLGGRDPGAFDTIIRVKANAAERLRRELPRLAADVISCGDWQEPAESRFRISRAMLEVVWEAGFPLVVIERSPLLLRDLDLLQLIQQRSWASVVLSFSNVDPALKRAFEPRSPGLRPRLKMMETIAHGGIPVGMALMPILPLVGDDDRHLEDSVRAARDHGASFVLASGLTMAGAQAERTLAAYRDLGPSFGSRMRELYRWPEGKEPTYGPPPGYASRLGLMVRELTTKYGLADRMPRYIGSGPLAVNRRLAERLFLKTYDLELERAPAARIWAYRKAAWAVDEWPANVGEFFGAEGEAGLRALPGIGASIAAEMGAWLHAIQLPCVPDRGRPTEG